MTDDPTRDPDNGFLNRWSRRKLEAEQAVEMPGLEPESAPDSENLPEPTADAEAQPPLDLPDVESLDKDSDFTVFMQDGVPEELKNMALRALWRSDPVLANLDGLNDYDEDFGSIVRVGAEFMRKLALEEDGKDTGDAFRPRDEPEEPESEESDDVDEIVMAQEPGEDQEEDDPEDDPKDDGDLPDETS
jgi:hypothetical protein